MLKLIRLILSSFSHTEKRGLWRQKSIGEFTQGQGISGIANAELENVYISCTAERENQHLPCLWLIENLDHHQLQLQEGGVCLEGTERSKNCSQSLCGIIVQRNHFPPSIQKEEKTTKIPLNPKKSPTVPHHTLFSVARQALSS